MSAANCLPSSVRQHDLHASMFMGVYAGQWHADVSDKVWNAQCSENVH